MREFGSFEAKNKFANLLDQVERGDEVVITRRGEPVAKLVPLHTAHTASSPTRAADAARRILARSRKAELGGLDIKRLTGKGRT
jgi:prevent-host-death family protein